MNASRRCLQHRLPPWSSLSTPPSARRFFNSSVDIFPKSTVATGDSDGNVDEKPISRRVSSIRRTHNPNTDPTRDILWSNEATKTLIEAWGDRYLKLNRGSLKQHHWEEVTAAVNFRHGDELRCTDIQAKNRIDTVKKKYKKEKARISESAGKYVSSWQFFDLLDFLVGSQSPVTSETFTRRRTPAFTVPPFSVPFVRRAKRPAPELKLISDDENLSRRKFEAIAAVAATMADEEAGIMKQCNKNDSVEFRQIAQAIEKFGERYERVEKEKLNMIIELENHKMQLAMDLNVQTMNFISELKVQLERNQERPEAKTEKESEL